MTFVNLRCTDETGLLELRCTCRWVGEGNDPDAHLKRDEWCPIHGRDPDYEREKRRDEP